MTAAASVEAPEEARTTGGGKAPRLIHFYCACDPDISLCGEDISGLPDEGTTAPPGAFQPCVVCDDQRQFPCVRGCS